MLGYHVLAGDSNARDCMAKPLRDLDKVLAAFFFVAQSGSGHRAESSYKIAHTSSLCIRALRTAVRHQFEEKGYPLARKQKRTQRSEKHPWGLPGIEHTSPPDATWVRTANCLHEFTAECTETLTTNNTMWCVENPRSSLMWCACFSSRLERGESVI